MPSTICKYNGKPSNIYIAQQMICETRTLGEFNKCDQIGSLFVQHLAV